MIGIQAQNIVDILPLTDFQADCITRGIDQPRQALNYFFLDLGANLDLKRLQYSCNMLLNHFPILRTAFVPFLGKLWQVVLRELDYPFVTLTVEEDLTQACQAICLRNMENGFRLGHPPILFILVRHHIMGDRLIVRLSHAQYDGVCLPVIIRTLANFYHRNRVGPSIAFSAFLAHSLRENPSSRAYWRGLLDGSHITQVTPKLSRKTCLDTAPQMVETTALISTPQLTGNVTIASLVSSAWAILLSSITGEEDVVYGHLVAGRNAAISGVEEIVGPCANIIPVRARVSSERTPSDLILSIREQYISLGEADSLGFKDIIKYCTDWPVESTFDSTVQHQNVDEHPQFPFTDVPTRLWWYKNPNVVPSALVIVSYPELDGLKLRILANSHIMTTETADALLDCLCRTIGSLSIDPYSQLGSFIDDNFSDSGP